MGLEQGYIKLYNLGLKVNVKIILKHVKKQNYKLKTVKTSKKN